MGRTFFLAGPPSTGKTSIALAIAQELDLKNISLNSYIRSLLIRSLKKHEFHGKLQKINRFENKINKISLLKDKLLNCKNNNSMILHKKNKIY